MRPLVSLGSLIDGIYVHTLKVIKDKFKLRIENKILLYAFTHWAIKIAPRFLLLAGWLSAWHPSTAATHHIQYCLRLAAAAALDYHPSSTNMYIYKYRYYYSTTLEY